MCVRVHRSLCNLINNRNSYWFVGLFVDIGSKRYRMAKRSSGSTDAVAPSLDHATYSHLFMEARTVRSCL